MELSYVLDYHICFVNSNRPVVKTLFLNNQLLYNGYVIIDKFFYLTYLENRGAAFGIFQDGRWFFIITTIIASGVMVWYFIKNNNFLLRVSLMLIVSGESAI